MAEYSIFIRPALMQQYWQVMSDRGFTTDTVEVIDPVGAQPHFPPRRRTAQSG